MVMITKNKMNCYKYKDWNTYFTYNRSRRLILDFSKENGLSEKEKALVFPSIQAFQKGEGSDGKYLMETVDEYVHANGVKEYREAMRQFIAEENCHSAYLKQYMDFYHVKGKQVSLLDNIFRKLRQQGGLKCEVTVLVTAEMIALTYYDALAESTGSPVLKSICRQMLHDELAHIMFQSHTLSRCKHCFYDKFVRIFLMEVTLLFVWGAFHKVYRAGGYHFSRFLKENMGYLRQSVYLSEKTV